MAALFMVFLFLAFLVTDLIIRKIQSGEKPALSTVGAVHQPAVPIEINPNEIALPAGLFFHRGHTWAKLDISGKVFIGIDDFLQKIIGRIDKVKTPKVGEIVARDEKLFAVQQGERSVSFVSPVDGVIESINEEALKNIETLKKEPYEKGWLLSIKPTNLTENIKTLLIAEDARNWVKSEIVRFKEFLAEQLVQDKKLGQTMADGGVPINGIMEHLDDLSWMKLEEEFLHQ